MTNIFYQSGMKNNYNIAATSASLIEKATARGVGLIINNTNSQYGVTADIIEYLPSVLTLKDALNGEVFQQIANNGNQKNLVILHSAGNEDALKSAAVLKLNNVNLDGKIDFISVGSPVSNSSLKQAIEPIGGNIIGQYNNWKDPVTHSKTWAIGASSLFVAGVAYGGSVGVGITSGVGAGLEVSTPLQAFFASGLKLTATAAGGAAGFGTGYYNLKIQHPFDSYFNKDFNGLQTDIEKWSAQNPVK